jgi:hypothetical protein
MKIIIKSNYFFGSINASIIMDNAIIWTSNEKRNNDEMKINNVDDFLNLFFKSSKQEILKSGLKLTDNIIIGETLHELLQLLENEIKKYN